MNIFGFYINNSKISFNLVMHFVCSPFLSVALPHHQGLSSALYSTWQKSLLLVRKKDKTASFTDICTEIAAVQPLPNDTEILAGLLEMEEANDNDSSVEF